MANTPDGTVLSFDDERAAFKSGRMFIFATGNNGNAQNMGISVPAGSYLNCRIQNNSTTRTWYIAPFGRFLDSTSASSTSYGGISNPDVLTSAQAATLSSGNITNGTCLDGSGRLQSDIVMTFGVGSLMTVGGTPGVPTGTGIIYPGMKNEISKPRGLPPGKVFGQYLVGQSTGLTGATAIFLGLRCYMYYDI